MNDDQLKDFININYSSIGKYLDKLSPLEFSTLGSLIGLLLVQSLTVDEQNSIGNLFELIGQVLLTSAAQAQLQSPDLELSTFINFKKKYHDDINFILKLIKKKIK